MTNFSCKKCGSVDLFIKENGVQTGLYCSDCGSWIKWLGKNDKRLAEKQIEETKNEIESIKNQNTKINDNFNNLKRVSEPLIKFLNDNYNPETIAIVCEGKVEILSIEMCMPLKVRD